jgi:hypothetical protein
MSTATISVLKLPIQNPPAFPFKVASYVKNLMFIPDVVVVVIVLINVLVIGFITYMFVLFAPT